MGAINLAPISKEMKVSIIGMSDSWKKAPMDGETWGLNALILRRPVKRMFLMHDIDLFLEKNIYQMKEVIDEVNKLGIPVMTLKKHKLLPNSIEYPIGEMHSRYFTSSFGYMIAYAVKYLSRFQFNVITPSIDLYGIGLVKRLEYREQKACIEYWLGYARGKGIDVRIFGLTTLFSTMGYAGLYGYEWCKDYQKIPNG